MWYRDSAQYEAPINFVTTDFAEKPAILAIFTFKTFEKKFM